MNFLSRLLHKYNGHIAVVIALAVLVSGSVQAMHDQLSDHHHDHNHDHAHESSSDCHTCALESSKSAPLPLPAACGIRKQSVEAIPFTPLSLVLNAVDVSQARAPPTCL